VDYERAPEVERLAKQIIDKSHPTLRGIRIEYVFREKAGLRHGRLVAGSAKKITGVNALLATPGARSSEDLEFFLVTIARDVWDRSTASRRIALVDHELQHCHVQLDDVTGEAVLAMRGHDIEEFAAIVQRHGLWTDDLEMFVTALPAEQLSAFASMPRHADHHPAGRDDEDFAVTITSTTADGKTRSVNTSTGEISAAADLLRHGSGLLDLDAARRLRDGETPGQDDQAPED
jgi:hypothetical protein